MPVRNPLNGRGPFPRPGGANPAEVGGRRVVCLPLPDPAPANPCGRHCRSCYQPARPKANARNQKTLMASPPKNILLTPFLDFEALASPWMRRPRIRPVIKQGLCQIPQVGLISVVSYNLSHFNGFGGGSSVPSRRLLAELLPKAVTTS